MQANDDEDETSGSEMEEEPERQVSCNLQREEREKETKLLQAVMKQSAELTGTSASKAKVNMLLRYIFKKLTTDNPLPRYNEVKQIST